MRILRLSTAQTERIGPYLDKTDGVTEETGLTPATEISKDGGAFAAGPAGTHDAEGWYSVALTTAHTNTLGSLVIKSQAVATHLPVWHEFMVVSAKVYDSLWIDSDNLEVDLTLWKGVAPNALVASRIDSSVGAMAANVITAAAINAAALTAAKFATDAIGAAQFATDAVNEIRDAILSDATKFPGAALTEARFSELDEATGGKMANQIDLIKNILGALTDAAAAGDPTATDTVVAYIKQIINTLEGTAGIPIFPASADPANNVSLAETVRAIRDDVTGLAGAVMRGTDGVDTAAMRGTDGVDTAAMRGTNSAALASVATEARLSELDEATAGKMANEVDLIKTDVVAILVDTVAGGAGPWTTGSGTGLTPLASGTAQGGTASTIQLAASETFADDELNGNVVKITAGTGKGQSRVVLDYAGATDTATVSPDWTTNPAADSVYEVVPGSSNVAAVSNVGEDLPTATALASVQTDVTTIKAKTDSLAFTGGNVHSRTKAQDDLALTAQQKTDVEKEADDALILNHLDHLFKTDYDPASKPGVVTALLNELIENDGGVSRYTANALEQAPAGGASLTKLDVAKAWRDQDVHGTAINDGSNYRRFFGENKTATGAGFEERGTVTSGNITKALNPDMGIIFTSMLDASPDQYYGPDLVGMVIVNDGSTSDATKRNYVITGGYFFTKGSPGTVSKVFGSAKKMGIVNGVVTGSNGGAAKAGWSGANLNEDSAATNGWVFFTHALPGGDSDFPLSGEDLHLEVPTGMINLQSSIDEGSTMITGVAFSNQRKKSITYDVNNNPVSYELVIYNNASDAELDVNPLQRFSVVTTYKRDEVNLNRFSITSQLMKQL